MEGLRERRRLADAAAIDRALRRMALEVVERGGGIEGLVLVGIHTGGVPLARRLCGHLGGEVPVGMIDITLYRDDVFIGLPQPVVGQTEIPADIDGARVVLVDDVLFTGRTTRAALDALMDFGRPRRIELAVLVDRGHRELPIQADYVGFRVQTTRDETVDVRLGELGAPEDAVLLLERVP